MLTIAGGILLAIVVLIVIDNVGAAIFNYLGRSKK